MHNIGCMALWLYVVVHAIVSCMAIIWLYGYMDVHANVWLYLVVWLPLVERGVLMCQMFTCFQPPGCLHLSEVDVQLRDDACDSESCCVQLHKSRSCSVGLFDASN